MNAKKKKKCTNARKQTGKLAHIKTLFLDKLALKIYFQYYIKRQD